MKFRDKEMKLKSGAEKKLLELFYMYNLSWSRHEINYRENSLSTEMKYF